MKYPLANPLGYQSRTKVRGVWLKLLLESNLQSLLVPYFSLSLADRYQLTNINTLLQFLTFSYFTIISYIRPAILLKKRLYHRCIPVNFAKYLRTHFLWKTSKRLLLYGREVTSFKRGSLLTVCCCHVTYTFQSESTLYNCLNVKEILARSRREIWSLAHTP